jgi:glutamate-1-semialdehyde 2,1-aminomutase
VGLFVGHEAPTDFEGARRTDETAYAALFHALLARGVALAPGGYEIMFPGLAHDDTVVDAIVARAADAAAEVVGRA